MSRAEQERLAALPYSYNFVGATAGKLPGGYHHVSVVEPIGRGRAVFDTAADRILSWGMHERAGLHVTATGPAAPDVLAVVRISLGPVTLAAPVRVVTAAHEETRAGFAYGTLPGHPEAGEESFHVELLPDETVVATVKAFSVPARWYTRLGGPVGVWMQRRQARRYVDVLR